LFGYFDKILNPQFMIHSKSKNIKWFARAFNVQQSVLPKIWVRLIFVILFSVVVTFAFFKDYSVSLPVLASVVPNVILGLLLVFRTNTAYDRFWEGRKLWGSLVNNVRSVARVISSTQGITRDQKIELLEHLSHFAELTKDIFFGELDRTKLTMNQKHLVNPNLFELQLLQNKLYYLNKEQVITDMALDNLTSKLDNLTDVIGGCQRIINTPIPLAYSIHIKQLILLYCLSVPFQFVGQVGVWTPILTFVICFALMGIEEIGLEIENPFGRDQNDLDLEKFVSNIKLSINESFL
jgi:ion channel-forming bestrophin family protein